MTITQIIQNGDGQAVLLPAAFQFASNEVTIRREGDSVILEPLGLERWPEGFFEQIRIDDPGFQRPDQGVMPAAPQIGSS